MPLTITGTDGIQPIYEPNNRWCWWALSEIYTGQTGLGKFVPKQNDFVMDPETYDVYRVIGINPTTYIPVLEITRPPYMTGVFTPPDILFGVGPGTPSDTYRLYIDSSTTPATLTVDNRLFTRGAMASYARIYKGSALDNTPIAIAAIYDNSGNVITTNIPLELVAVDNVTNYTTKTIIQCHSTMPLTDGEIVTAVLYSSSGIVISKRQLMIENTSFLKSTNVSQKYIVSISLESPFLSNTVPNNIAYPTNLPISGLNLTGVINYSDGSTSRLPVDGTKFKLLGLGQHMSGYIGQTVNLVLTYSLSNGELTFIANNNNTINVPYSLTAINPINSYSVKLFGYPVWGGPGNGYTMRWYLTNLDRNVWFDVTTFVTFDPSTGSFNPTAYGYLQRKLVTINLHDVSGSFSNYVYSQLVDITLSGVPNGTQSSWTVSHVSGSDIPPYGSGLVATYSSSNSSVLNISCGVSDVNTWLQRVYWETYPMKIPTVETEAPVPTHFIITYNSVSSTYPVSSFNAAINIGTAFASGHNVTIRFINRTGSGDLQLSVAEMIIAQI